MQAYFSRVLAGQIRKPGSFSPTTIEVLTRLTPETAKLFQHLCNISGTLSNGETFVLAEPFGHPGTNALAPIGFSFPTLSALQDAGLISPQLETSRLSAPLMFALHIFVLAGVPMHLTCDLKPSELIRHIHDEKNKIDLRTVLFTRAGRELRNIVHMTPNPQYVAKFIEWAELNKMRLVTRAAKI